MVAGVAASLAARFHIDVSIVRVAIAVLAILGFTPLGHPFGIPLFLGGIPLYLAGWLLIPEEGSEHSIVGRFFAERREHSD